jgi:hypothetical protein
MALHLPRFRNSENVQLYLPAAQSQTAPMMKRPVSSGTSLQLSPSFNSIADTSSVLRESGG